MVAEVIMMSDMNNNHQSGPNDEAPKSSQGQNSSSTWKRLLAKKWVFPATYMVAAAIILSLMWAYQGNDDQPLAEDVNPGLQVSDGLTGTSDPMFPDVDTAPVNATLDEEMQWPVLDSEAITVLMPFFDESAPQEERAAALIQQGNEFKPHMGVSIGAANDEAFDIAAAKSGIVTRVETLSMVGHLVEITHDDGLVTVYQSLQNIVVSENEEVVKGQVIAQAGRNELERDLGVHLHFEVREQDQPVNPRNFLPALATDLADDEEEAVQEEEATEEDAASDDAAN
jgi:stage II sporulation protein Q